MEKLLMFIALVSMASCSSALRLADIKSSGLAPALSLDGCSDELSAEESDAVEESHDQGTRSRDGSFIMNAVKDQETGEMVAADVISASRVEARFRHAAERGGQLTLGFDIIVPDALMDSRWQLRIYPELSVMEDTVLLDPLLITGEKYNEIQLKGYQRYRKLLSSILTDSTDFLKRRSAEIFLERYFPEIYSMKSDSSVIADTDPANIFGVRKQEVLEHYTRYGLMARNEKRKEESERILESLRKSTVISFCLDTMIADGSGSVCYRYDYIMEARAGLKKIPVCLKGGIFEAGELLYSMPDSEPAVFYVSSLSSLADTAVRYRTKTISRYIVDHTEAVIDFAQGQHEIDTSLASNKTELQRIRSRISDLSLRQGLVADSVVVTASCSPEGNFIYNSRLSRLRAEAVMSCINHENGICHDSLFRVSSVSEDWRRLIEIARKDSAVSVSTRGLLSGLPYGHDPDRAEIQLSAFPEYGYIRNTIYPMLRTVRIDFHLHRKDMQEDTVFTQEIDSVYMKGVRALCNMDYREAVRCLGNYMDYNSALAYVSAGYDDRAVEILEYTGLRTSKENYLMALAMARLGRTAEAVTFLKRSVSLNPSMIHRGRLDPELSSLLERINF